MALTDRLLLPGFCLLFQLALATFDDVVDLIVPGSAMSGLVKHYTSEKLHQLLMDSTENREELQKMRKALE